MQNSHFVNKKTSNVNLFGDIFFFKISRHLMSENIKEKYKNRRFNHFSLLEEELLNSNSFICMIPNGLEVKGISNIGIVRDFDNMVITLGIQNSSSRIRNFRGEYDLKYYLSKPALGGKLHKESAEIPLVQYCENLSELQRQGNFDLDKLEQIKNYFRSSDEKLRNLGSTMVESYLNELNIKPNNGL